MLLLFFSRSGAAAATSLILFLSLAGLARTYPSDNPYYGAVCDGNPEEIGTIVPDPPSGGFSGASIEEPPAGSCTPGMYGIATSWGDPHIETYDDMEFDCQNFGDHILSKSNNSDFMIQARFDRPPNVTKFWTCTRAVVLKESTPGLPVIEISYPMYSENESTLPCFKFLVVDGVEETPIDGKSWTSDDGRSVITFNEEEAGLKWSLTMNQDGNTPLILETTDRLVDANWGWGCMMTARVHMDLCYRKDEAIFGMFGNNNGILEDDWSDLQGNLVIKPPTTSKDRHYCNRWCIADKDDSIFTYNPDTVGAFENRCISKRYDDEKHYMNTVDPVIKEKCLSEAYNFVNCVLEETIGDPKLYFEDEAAIATITGEEEYKWVLCAPGDAACKTGWGAKEDLMLENAAHAVLLRR